MKRREKLEGFAGQRLVVVPRPVVASVIHDPLLTHLLLTDAGYYPRATGHACTRPRGCPEVVFIYCTEGTGWCEIAGRRHEVGKDQLLVITAGTPHAYGTVAQSPWSIFWFHAIGLNVPFYLKRLGVSNEKPIVSLGGDPQVLSLFEDILEGLQHGFTLTHLIYAAHSLAHLMGLLLRHKEEFWQGETSARERIEKNVQFMKSHLREPLNIATLTSLVNLSRSHYTTLFRRVTGYAPLNYLNHLRMQRAVELLNSTNWPIKQISDHLGFSDQFYFSRAFTKMYDHSPSEHRRRYVV